MLDDIENKLIAQIKAATGNVLRKVETHPGRWSDAVIKKMITVTPSVYIGFSSGTYKDQGYGDAILGTWHVFITADALNGRVRKPGIYQLAKQLIPALHGFDLEQPDSLKFKGIKDVFSYAQANQGFSCYELTFELLMGWPEQIDPASLDDWLRATGEHYDENDPNHLMATDAVELPGGENP